jgi:hypothetical protein
MADQQRVRSGYEEIDVVRDPDGVIAIISRRVAGPPICTIGIFKVFLRDGIEEKSSFFGHKQIPAVARVLEIAAVRARELEDAAMTDYNLRPAAANGRR